MKRIREEKMKEKKRSFEAIGHKIESMKSKEMQEEKILYWKFFFQKPVSSFSNDTWFIMHDTLKLPKICLPKTTLIQLYDNYKHINRLCRDRSKLLTACSIEERKGNLMIFLPSVHCSAVQTFKRKIKQDEERGEVENDITLKS